MAKKRLSKKHNKNNKKVDKKVEITTNHASLCALAPVIRDKNVFEPIHINVKIPQKKLLYSPTDKLVFLTLGIMSGIQSVYDINYILRIDKALLNAFGYDKCADQSVIQETLNAVTEDNISQMESALKTIWEQNNLS